MLFVQQILDFLRFQSQTVNSISWDPTSTYFSKKIKRFFVPRLHRFSDLYIEKPICTESAATWSFNFDFFIPLIYEHTTQKAFQSVRRPLGNLQVKI